MPAILNRLDRDGNGMRVAHWTPGRVRLAFSNAEDGETFANSVRGVRGVTSAEFNPLTGSVLIRYHEKDQELSPLLEARLSRRRPSVTHSRGHGRCPACQQAIRAERDALPTLVRLTGSVITGDVFGVVCSLISMTQEDRDFYDIPPSLQTA